MTVEVRPAAPGDADAVAAIQVHAWQAAYPGIMSQGWLDAMDVEPRAVTWREIIAAPGPGNHVVVAVAGGAPVGFAAFGAARGLPAPDAVGELFALNVDPPRWRAGAGSALIGHAHAGLTADGHRTAVLWVFTANERARRFYERHGWAADGTTQTQEIGGALAHETRYDRTL